MEEIRVRGQRAVGAAVLTVGLAGAALVLTTELFRTPFFAVVCGAAILGGLIGLVDRRVQLALSDEGIRYRRWGPTVVPWHEFSGFRWVTWRHSRQLQLVARRPSELPEAFSRLGRLNHLCCRLLRMPAFSIAVPPLAIAELELEAWISRHLPEDRALGADARRAGTLRESEMSSTPFDTSDTEG